MKELNWKKQQAGYIKKPLFVSYGAFEEKRPVLVDCSFGVNPLEGLYSRNILLQTGAAAAHSPDADIIPLAPYAMYPAGGAHGNKKMAAFIASRWPAVKPEDLCFAGGSQGCISSLSRILGGSRNKIQGYIPTFIPGLLEFAAVGARVEITRLSAPDYAVSAGLLLGFLQDDTTALYLDNPNNPTGHVLPVAEIAVLAKACADRGVLLIVDEAYSDFIDDANSALNLEDRNIICLRSVSKGCGFAGLRVGYIVIRDPELRHFYYELGLHFSCSALSADVAATLLPELDLPSMRKELAALKKKTLDFIRSCAGFTVAETAASTPIMLVSSNKTASLYDALMEDGIQTEPGKFFDLGDEAVRLRVPAPSKFELFCKQWKKAFA
ncbi:MAG: aminotransferase class I/II-fold pyridoxal phosphate-dependent enzyme [Deltaproteobacteria bacterium]|jgi:histidinol-phosphate aminotransferase|nr:aminotransferase class I/II-fold pyridoxal phosphate-dependent enzyme [Deltaproteobacteria bacterium]